MATTYERTDLGTYVRRGPEDGRDGMGRPVWVYVTHDGDTSSVHATYPTGYDDRCGWCWLGAAHSEDEHAARVSRAS